jgi:polysaccharide export outer membrane protein
MSALLARVFAVALLVVLGALSPAARAQSSADPGSGRLGVGDWVSIQIVGQPDVTSYVAPDGTINVPLIGNIPVAGITAAQASDRVAKALKDGGFFVSPQVTINSTEPQGQSVAVLGEVVAQGNYPITPRTTIVDLLARAGGVKETASEVGYVLRRDASGHVSQHPVSLSVLTNSQATVPVWEFLAGDSLVVPPAEHFTVTGEVRSPGRYRLEPDTTILQAIARAGGVNERGSERRIQIQRIDKPGHVKSIHAKPSDTVKGGDIILVKESLF